MENFVSLSDLLETNQSLNPIKEEVLKMKNELKASMDRGLSSEEMLVAQKGQEAILAAESILEKF